MPYTYMVKCSDETIYTGWTIDIEMRLDAHNKGKGAKYTRGRRPVVLVWSEYHDEPKTAQAKEAAIKKLNRAKKEKMIFAWQESKVKK